jgi:hypothetical protein
MADNKEMNIVDFPNEILQNIIKKSNYSKNIPLISKSFRDNYYEKINRFLEKYYTVSDLKKIIRNRKYNYNILVKKIYNIKRYWLSNKLMKMLVKEAILDDYNINNDNCFFCHKALIREDYIAFNMLFRNIIHNNLNITELMDADTIIDSTYNNPIFQNIISINFSPQILKFFIEAYVYKYLILIKEQKDMYNAIHKCISNIIYVHYYNEIELFWHNENENENELFWHNKEIEIF